MSFATSKNINNGTLRKIFVGLKNYEKSEVKTAKFLDCIVHNFIPNELFVKVTCKLQDNVLILCPIISQTNNELQVNYTSDRRLSVGCSDLGTIILQHSPECPVWRILTENITVDQPDVKGDDPGVSVGVAVVIESSDSHILMTQRPDHMRTFPRAWVPPGGHLEWDESLVECGLREVCEETGLRLDSSNSETHVLCLWESVYPVLLGLGLPKRHHIVVYLRTKTTETWRNLQARTKLNPDEVQACTWLSVPAVESLCSNHRDFRGISKFTTTPSGEVQTSELDLATMFHPSLWQDGQIYSGSQLALTKWLQVASCPTTSKM